MARPAGPIQGFLLHPGRHGGSPLLQRVRGRPTPRQTSCSRAEAPCRHAEPSPRQATCLDERRLPRSETAASRVEAAARPASDSRWVRTTRPNVAAICSERPDNTCQDQRFAPRFAASRPTEPCGRVPWCGEPARDPGRRSPSIHRRRLRGQAWHRVIRSGAWLRALASRRSPGRFQRKEPGGKSIGISSSVPSMITMSSISSVVVMGSPKRSSSVASAK
jgi:hypothetical protein